MSLPPQEPENTGSSQYYQISSQDFEAVNQIV